MGTMCASATVKFWAQNGHQWEESSMSGVVKSQLWRPYRMTGMSLLWNGDARSFARRLLAITLRLVEVHYLNWRDLVEKIFPPFVSFSTRTYGNGCMTLRSRGVANKIAKCAFLSVTRFRSICNSTAGSWLILWDQARKLDFLWITINNTNCVPYCLQTWPLIQIQKRDRKAFRWPNRYSSALRSCCRSMFCVPQ